MHLQLLPAGAGPSLSQSAATLVMLLLRRCQFRSVAVARRNVYLLCVWQLLVIFGIACGPKWFACEALYAQVLYALLRRSVNCYCRTTKNVQNYNIVKPEQIRLVRQRSRHQFRRMQMPRRPTRNRHDTVAKPVRRWQRRQSWRRGSNELYGKRQTVHCLTFILLLRTN